MRYLAVIVMLLHTVSALAAQVVLIDTGTRRVGINNIGDIVEIQEDDVDLNNFAYATFDIVNVQASDGITAAELNAKIAELTASSASSKYRGKLTLNGPQRTALANGTYTKAEVFAFMGMYLGVNP